MRRRSFITLLGGAAAAWPLAARAQQVGMRRIGVLFAGPEGDPYWEGGAAVLREGLRKLGWVVGRNLAIDYRWDTGDVARARIAAAEILALTPDAVLSGGAVATRALYGATRTVPVVFTVVSEPVENGYVASLARPGGNITGFTNLEYSVGTKWLELLKEIAPGVKRVAFVHNPPASPPGPKFYQPIEAAAPKFGVHSTLVQVHDTADFEPLMAALARDGSGGLIFVTDSFINLNRKMIIALAARYRLPAIYSQRHYSTDGGLLSYGINTDDQYRLAAGYIDRILKGEKAADLPVQQPVKFELVINMKTAKALGLIVPLTLQVAADEVIE
jgi:putative tryptophan/tyrosine transport system substrate-binding protein